MPKSVGVLLAALTLASVALAAAPASANGRFPQAGLIVFEPSNPAHVVVSTTFGLLESRDARRTFLWRCELALSIQGQQDTMVAVTESGATIATTFDGIIVSDDGCNFSFAPDLKGQIVPDVSHSASAPHEVLAFHMIGIGNEEYDSQIVKSVDDGRTWTNLGPPLPRELLPVSIDVAPTDPTRVYLSGRLGTADGYASVLMRSGDGGVTFQRVTVPETTVERLAYIAAVHPKDAGRVYVRVDDTAGTVIWSSEDGGQSLRKRFTGTARLLGFAVSPDGNEIALGGANDGTWVGPTDGTAFERRSDVGPSCLAWNGDGLHACADAKQNGFSLGLSRDGARTFEPVLAFADLCGTTGCAPSTNVGKTCPGEWPTIGPTLGATCGLEAPDAATRDASPTDAKSADETPSMTDVPVASGGCSCKSSRGARAPWCFSVLLLLFARRRVSCRRAAPHRAHLRPSVSRSLARGPCAP